MISFGTSGLTNVDLAGTKSIADGQLDVSTNVTGTLATITYQVTIGDHLQARRRFACLDRGAWSSSPGRTHTSPAAMPCVANAGLV